METRDDKGHFKPGTHWRKKKPHWDKDWCLQKYVTEGLSAKEMADLVGVTENAIYFWLAKHGIPRRTMREVRTSKSWGSSGADNPMWNKFGELNPNWKGGVTAERQLFYQSREWKIACSAVWKRDNATCVRCGIHKNDAPDIPFHIHHIRSFSVVETRADTNNLVLLCEICHQWVHSRKNVDHEYLCEV